MPILKPIFKWAEDHTPAWLSVNALNPARACKHPRVKAFAARAPQRRGKAAGDKGAGKQPLPAAAAPPAAAAAGGGELGARPPLEPLFSQVRLEMGAAAPAPAGRGVGGADAV